MSGYGVKGGVWGCRREGVQGYLGEGSRVGSRGGVGRAGGLPGGLGRGLNHPRNGGTLTSGLRKVRWVDRGGG